MIPRPATTTLVLLPGMDGTGALFTPLLREFSSSAVKPQVVSYPPDRPLGYAELVPRRRPFKRGTTSCSASRSPGPRRGHPRRTPPAPAARGLILACSFVARRWLHLLAARHSPACCRRRGWRSRRSACCSWAADPRRACAGRWRKRSPRWIRPCCVTAPRRHWWRTPAATWPRPRARCSGTCRRRTTGSSPRVVPTRCGASARAPRWTRLRGPHFLQTQPAAAAAECIELRSPGAQLDAGQRGHGPHGGPRPVPSSGAVRRLRTVKPPHQRHAESNEHVRRSALRDAAPLPWATSFDGEIRVGGNYVSVVRDGDALRQRTGAARGQRGRGHGQRRGPEVALAQAQFAAKICAMRALAIPCSASSARSTKVRRVLRITVFVQSAAGFTQQSEVADGATCCTPCWASRAGIRAPRWASTGCPKNASVEIDLIASSVDDRRQ